MLPPLVLKTEEEVKAIEGIESEYMDEALALREYLQTSVPNEFKNYDLNSVCVYFKNINPSGKIIKTENYTLPLSLYKYKNKKRRA